MNPLLFKAHPLMMVAVDLFTNPAAHDWTAYMGLLAILICSAGVAASALRWSVVKSVDIQVGYHAAFWLSLPAMLLYLLPMITLMADVLDHRFHWRDRFMLVMWVVLASSMLAVLYAFGIRQIRYNRAIGLQAGLEASLTLLLMTLLIALALNGLDSAFSLW